MGRKKSEILSAKKRGILFLAVFLLMTGVTGGTTAYLVRRAEPLNRTFEAGKVSCEVLEEDECIKICSKSDTEVFVRAVILVNWTDEEGNIRASSPKAGEDYFLEPALDKWQIAEDGIWYYTEALEAEGEVELFRKVELLSEAPEGYSLTTEIHAEAVQAAPAEALPEGWPRVEEETEEETEEDEEIGG